ncbi:MAG TPA: GlsB/YeaQ/YmgE family stress response membrane protein [Dongiaceae bacterium]|nr:GlsB/YeaQ/YmgE family stress response membrane protein [Dongiaceae bacterium]
MFAPLAVLQEKVVVVQWWPRGVLAWLFLGLVAGWLAGKLVRGRGFGCIGDVVLGLIGSVIGGWVFTKLQITGGPSFLFSLAAATLGAVILVSIAHLFFGGKHE